MTDASHFISTRGQAPRANFSEVLLAGLAPDGGLYMPAAWPQFSQAEIAAFQGMRYQEVAFHILSRFVGDAFSAADLKSDIEAAYAGFDAPQPSRDWKQNAAPPPEIVPLSDIGPDTHLLELFHGPTFAFKDIALQVLG